MFYSSKCFFLTSLCLAITLVSGSLFSEVVTVPTHPNTLATGPATRPRIDDLQKESSSFVADPDPLDPLPVKNESLKEGEEPVLEDIRQILNAPQKDAPTGNKQLQKKSENKLIPQKKTSSNSVKKIKKMKQSSHKRSTKKNRLAPDEPDLKIENTLFQEYKKFNDQPTSVEQWEKVTSDRKVEIFNVEKGNTLESISRILFGDSKFWPKIWALNHTTISNPHFIYPGMKIYFYPATAAELPSLNVGVPFDPSIATSGLSLDGRDYTPQQTDFEKFTIRYQNSVKGRTSPQPIPESLPLVRRKEYFEKSKKTEILIDIKPRPDLVVEAPKNPYVLSSEALTTDFIVPSEQIDDLICRTNQFVPQVKKINLQASIGKVILVEPLKTENFRLKKTFVYKIIGEANVNDSYQMRIQHCYQLMNSDTMIVSEEKIQTLPVPTETLNSKLGLVESLESPMQDFFNFGQRVIINAVDLSPEVGQELSIYSESAGSVVGKLKILKSAGTLAIGYLTEISHLIQIGDRVQRADGLEKKSVEALPSNSLEDLSTESDLSL